MGKRIATALCLMICICGQVIAQQIKASGQPLAEVLQQIQQKTDYRFFWMFTHTVTWQAGCLNLPKVRCRPP